MKSRFGHFECLGSTESVTLLPLRAAFQLGGKHQNERRLFWPKSMTPADQPPDQAENDRRFERMLAVDKYRQERWQSEITAPQHQAWDAQKIAMRFGEIALQAAFLVNGGALIALPPLMEWLSQKGRASVPGDAAIFVAGLFFAAACALTAYLNFLFIAAVLGHHSEKRAMELRAEFSGNALKPDNPEFLKITGKLRWKQRVVVATLIAAVTFGLLSYVTFGFGAYAFIGLAHHNGDFVNHSGAQAIAAHK